MKVFAIVLADPNPIHLDPEATRAAGLGDRVINQGPASFGYVLNMLREAVPGARITDLNVRLSANVFGGDKVTAAGRVESVQDEADGHRIACAVWLDVEGGRRARCRERRRSCFPRAEAMGTHRGRDQLRPSGHVGGSARNRAVSRGLELLLPAARSMRRAARTGWV